MSVVFKIFNFLTRSRWALGNARGPALPVQPSARLSALKTTLIKSFPCTTVVLRDAVAVAKKLPFLRAFLADRWLRMKQKMCFKPHRSVPHARSCNEVAVGASSAPPRLRVRRRCNARDESCAARDGNAVQRRPAARNELIRGTRDFGESSENDRASPS